MTLPLRILPLAFGLLAASCAFSFAAVARVAVVVSVPPQAYLVERVGGANVEVRVMIPPGATPPSYAPRPRQLADLDQAALVVLVGHPGFVFERVHIRPRLAGRPAIRVVDMSAGASPGGDPHVWLEPSAVDRAVAEIGQQLAKIDPEHAKSFRANAAAFRAELSALDDELRRTLSGGRGGRLLLNHPAWDRFARHYGLVTGTLGKGGVEPGPRALVALIERERERGTRQVFVQRGFPHKGARRLAEAIGAQVVEVDPLARDWPDNLRRTAALFARALDDG